MELSTIIVVIYSILNTKNLDSALVNYVFFFIDIYTKNHKITTFKSEKVEICIKMQNTEKYTNACKTNFYLRIYVAIGLYQKT